MQIMATAALHFGRSAVGRLLPTLLRRKFAFTQNSAVNAAAPIHTSCKRFDLMEFFDDPKNWGAQEVRSGRSWTKNELRIKSNADLHKLWYVLLKEYNMLLTMEEAAKREVELFPSPERKDKVEESMENLEAVIRERNRAYHLLETGETGERPTEKRIGPLGLEEEHKMSEYLIPKEANKEWQEMNFEGTGNAVATFVKMMKGQEAKEKRKALRRQRNHVRHILKKFPNVDMEALREQYPDVDIDKIKYHLALYVEQ